MPNQLSFIAVLLLVTACGSSKDVGRPGPDHVNAMMLREAEPMGLQSVKSKDNFLAFKTEAVGEVKIVPPKGNETFYLAHIPLGGIAPMTCIFYKENVDLAASLSNINASVLEQLPQREVSVIDVGMLGRAPYMRIDYTYYVQQKNGTAAGYYKSAIAEKPGATVICSHDEAGYRSTFFRIFSKIASSLNSKSMAAADKPHYTEVFVYSANKQPVGIYVTEIFNGKDGGKVSRNKSAFLFRQSGNEVTSSDGVSVEIEGKNGDLKEGTYVEVSNNTINHKVELTQNSRTEYEAKGSFQGKKLAGTVRSPRSMKGNYYQMKVLREGIASRKLKGFDVSGYNPQVSPLKPIEISYKPTVWEKNGAQVLMKIGKVESTLTTDGQGSARSIKVPVGSSYLTAERKYVNGVF